MAETRTEKVVISTGGRAPEIRQRTRSRYSSAYAAYFDNYNPSSITLRTIEKMERDPEIALGLSILKSPLHNAGWHIECADPRIRALVTCAYAKIHRELVRSAARALERGFNPHEKVWARAPVFDADGEDENGDPVTYRFENAFIYEKIKEVYPADVTIIKKDDRFAGFRQSKDGKTVTVPPEKAFLAVWEERDGNKYGRSILTNAYDDWYKDKAHAGHMMMYLERRGAPSIVVEYPAGRTVDADGNEKDNSEIALDIGVSIQNNSAITLPSDIDPETRENRWKVYYLKDDNRAVAFSTIHTAVFVPAKLRALLIPDLAAVKADAGGGGAFALGKVHKSVLTDIREDIIGWYVRLVNDYILPDLVRFNFGATRGAGAPAAKLVVTGLSDNKKDLWVEIVKELSKKPEFTKQIDMSEMLEGLGVPVAEPVGEVENEKRGEVGMWGRGGVEQPPHPPTSPPPHVLLNSVRGVTARQQENLEAQVRRIWRRSAAPEAKLHEITKLQLRYGGAYESALREALERKSQEASGSLSPRARAEMRVEAKTIAASHLARLESGIKRALIGSAGSGAGEGEAIRALREAFDRFRSAECGLRNDKRTR